MRGVMLFFALWAAFSLPSNAMVLPAQHHQQQQQLDSHSVLASDLKDPLHLTQEAATNETAAKSSTVESEHVEQPMEEKEATEEAKIAITASKKTELPELRKPVESKEVLTNELLRKVQLVEDMREQAVRTTFPIPQTTTLRPCVLAERASIYQFAEYAICKMLRKKAEEEAAKAAAEAAAATAVAAAAAATLEDGSGKAVENVNGEFIEELNSNEIHTFPYCSVLDTVKCRAVLLLLQQMAENEEAAEEQNSLDLMTQQQQQLQVPATNDISETETGAISLVGRKRRSLNEEQRLLQVLERYHKWRKNNGYGKAVGRWGRDVPDITGDEPSGHRVRRAGAPVDIARMLRLYRAWRAKYGYGQSNGRWGR